MFEVNGVATSGTRTDTDIEPDTVLWEHFNPFPYN